MIESLDLMTISAYIDEDFQSLIEKPYSVTITPDSLKWARNIDHHTIQDTSKSNQHQNSPNDKLNFDIIIDRTGDPGQINTNVSAEITALENVIYKYNGEIHRPNFVKLQWSKNMIFKGTLTSFDIDYTLFKPDGSPLRAKISLEFSSSVTELKINNNAIR